MRQGGKPIPDVQLLSMISEGEKPRACFQRAFRFPIPETMERKGKKKDFRTASVHALKCLECGQENIVDNKVCGYCGANLPLVYDRGGRAVRRVFSPATVKVNPHARMFARLVIIWMVAMGAFLIFRWLQSG